MKKYINIILILIIFMISIPTNIYAATHDTIRTNMENVGFYYTDGTKHSEVNAHWKAIRVFQAVEKIFGEAKRKSSVWTDDPWEYWRGAKNVFDNNSKYIDQLTLDTSGKKIDAFNEKRDTSKTERNFINWSVYYLMESDEKEKTNFLQHYIEYRVDTSGDWENKLAVSANSAGKEVFGENNWDSSSVKWLATGVDSWDGPLYKNSNIDLLVDADFEKLKKFVNAVERYFSGVEEDKENYDDLDIYWELREKIDDIGIFNNDMTKNVDFYAKWKAEPVYKATKELFGNQANQSTAWDGASNVFFLNKHLLNQIKLEDKDYKVDVFNTNRDKSKTEKNFINLVAYYIIESNSDEKSNFLQHYIEYRIETNGDWQNKLSIAANSAGKEVFGENWNDDTTVWIKWTGDSITDGVLYKANNKELIKNADFNTLKKFVNATEKKYSENEIQEQQAGQQQYESNSKNLEQYISEAGDIYEGIIKFYEEACGSDKDIYKSELIKTDLSKLRDYENAFDGKNLNRPEYVILHTVIQEKEQNLQYSQILDGDNLNMWYPTSTGSTIKTTAKVNTIAKIIRALGTVVSVVALAIIGMRIMFGSIEQKAQYKELLVPYLIGAVMLFGISWITSLIFELVN